MIFLLLKQAPFTKHSKNVALFRISHRYMATLRGEQNQHGIFQAIIMGMLVYKNVRVKPSLCRALEADGVYEPVTCKDYRAQPLKSWEEGKDSGCKKIGSEKIHKIPFSYNGSCSRKAIPLSILWTFHKSIGNGRADVPVARNEGSSPALDILGHFCQPLL